MTAALMLRGGLLETGRDAHAGFDKILDRFHGALEVQPLVGVEINLDHPLHALAPMMQGTPM